MKIGAALTLSLLFAGVAEAQPGTWSGWQRLAGDQQLIGCGVDVRWRSPRNKYDNIWYEARNSCDADAVLAFVTDKEGNQGRPTEEGCGARQPKCVDWLLGERIVSMSARLRNQPNPKYDKFNSVASQRLREAARQLLDWWKDLAKDALLATGDAERTPFDNVGSVLSEYKDRLQVAAEHARGLQLLLDRATRGEDVYAALQQIQDELRVSGEAVRASARSVAIAQRNAVIRSEQRAENRARDSIGAIRRAQLDSARNQFKTLTNPYSISGNSGIDLSERRIDADLDRERSRILALIDEDNREIQRGLMLGTSVRDPVALSEQRRSTVRQLTARLDQSYRDAEGAANLVKSVSALSRDAANNSNRNANFDFRQNARHSDLSRIAAQHVDRRERLRNAIALIGRASR